MTGLGEAVGRRFARQLLDEHTHGRHAQRGRMNRHD
jgi:hypothetical protein